MSQLRWLLIAMLLRGSLTVMAEEAALPFTPGQVIVRFDKPTTLAEASVVLDGKLFTVDKVLVKQLNIYLVKIAPDFSVEAALRELEGYSELRWAQADHLLKLRLTPNDPLFNSQWDMNQASDADIDAPEAWDITTGGTDPGSDDIVVAVVDGGCQLTHTDLSTNIWVNTNEIAGNGVDDDNNGYIDDRNGWDAYNDDGTIPSDAHGTHVSGTVGARGNNSLMVSGMNWNIKIMEVAASSGSTAIISIGYGYVLAMKQLWWSSGGTLGANVVSTNSSFGVDGADCESGSYPIWNDLYTAMGEEGILSAAATANQNWNIDIVGDVPTGCSSPYMIAVTNTTSTDQRNAGAAYGATTIDLGAPGTNILSTVPTNTTASYTGTSMASPHVAGAVAFLHAAASPSFYNYYVQNPDSGALIIKQIILENVDPIAALQGITVSGGRLNLFNAASEISTYIAPGVGEPFLLFGGSQVDDAAGDNDGLLDGGETVDVIATLNNLGETATNVTGTLSTADLYVTITDNSGVFGQIDSAASGSNLADPFILSADTDTPLEHVAAFTLSITADSGYSNEYSFELVIGQKAIYWSDSIETGALDWTHAAVSGGFSDAWHVSTEMSSSPSHAWKCGHTGTGAYPPLLDAGLVTPPVEITPQSTLHFQHWLESEISGAYPDSAYDGGVLEISADGGPFVSVAPVSGYPKIFRNVAGGGNPYTGPMPGRPCLAGNIGWSEVVVDLAPYVGQTVQVRFRFGSDQNTAYEGWYVDDVQIRGEPPTINPPDPVLDVTIYPAGDDINLLWSPSASGADYYVIYRSTNSEFAAEPSDSIGTTADTSFIDVGVVPSGEQNFYIIRAVRQ